MSGATPTYGSYRFSQRQILEHAFRRAGHKPELVGAENLQVAQDLLYLQLSEYINAGAPLWTQQFMLRGITIGGPDVTLPQGYVDVLRVYWRRLSPYRGGATTTAGQGAAVLFGGQPNLDLVIPGPNPGVAVAFGSPTELDTVGVLLGGSVSVTAALQVQISPDGFTWIVAQTLPLATYVPGQWTYFDLDPSVTSPFTRIVAPGLTSWTLNQLNFGLPNGYDIPIGGAEFGLNIDDYYDLPDKLFKAPQPNSAYVYRVIDPPIVKIWPTVDQQGFYAGTVAVLARRYIQDPGQLSTSLELPPRWNQAVIARLGMRIMDELPPPPGSAEANQYSALTAVQRREALDRDATKSEALAWGEERTKGPLRILPDFSPYTR